MLQIKAAVLCDFPYKLWKKKDLEKAALKVVFQESYDFP